MTWDYCCAGLITNLSAPNPLLFLIPAHKSLIGSLSRDGSSASSLSATHGFSLCDFTDLGLSASFWPHFYQFDKPSPSAGVVLSPLHLG
jgi:hypothetical protein